MHLGKLLLSVVLAIGLAGCARDRTVAASPDVELANLTELPVPEGLGVYRIGPQQLLTISVANAPMLTGAFLTDENGNLPYPLVGSIETAGLTPAQAAERIAGRLAGRYVVNPQVTVRPDNVPEATVSVGGEVDRPGSYPSQTATSLMRAINLSGGLTDFAKSDDVLILRTVGGQRYIGVYNLAAIQRGNYTDPPVYSEDIIVVGDSSFRRSLQSIIQVLPLLTTSAILLERTSN